MNEGKKQNWFDGIEEIVSDPLRFKAQLAIGEDAYTSVRIKNMASNIWQAGAAAGTAVIGASSATVASAFFAPTGMLAFFGIGTAVTPVGWLIAAAIVGGGGWVGVTRYLRQSTGSRVTTIPDFINTPVDVLALALFDLMAPLALKVASIDGEIHASERDVISSHFVKQWGFDPTFVREGIAFTENRLPEFSVEEMARSLAEFKKKNKDCNYREMSRELVSFLRELIEADGRIDGREEMAIGNIETVLKDVARFKFRGLKNKETGAVSDATKSSVKTESRIGQTKTKINLVFKKY